MWGGGGGCGQGRGDDDGEIALSLACEQEPECDWHGQCYENAEPPFQGYASGEECRAHAYVRV